MLDLAIPFRYLRHIGRCSLVFRSSRKRPNRCTEVHVAGDSRRTHPWVFDAAQREAGTTDELRDVTVDMAAIGRDQPASDRGT